MDPGIGFADLLAYSADETSHWKRWLRDHPDVLELPCEVASTGTVRKLLFHIFATELFFANKVLGLAPIDFEKLPISTLDELFAISEEAERKFQDFLEKAMPEDWAEVVPLGFSSHRASRRKMVTQAVLHGVHHRGQLATFLRQQGFKQDWIHDFILSKVME